MRDLSNWAKKQTNIRNIDIIVKEIVQKNIVYKEENKKINEKEKEKKTQSKLNLAENQFFRSV